MAGLSTGTPIVKVYHAKSMILPDVSRVLACLYEKDIRFETHTSSSYKGLPRLQASNHAPVPFYDGLTFLEESREICRYVAETYEHHGYPFLLGEDSLERASIEQWLHHEEHTFNPPSRSLFCHLAFPLDEEDDDIDLQKRKLEEVLDVYEQRLSDSEFLAGNKFTLADLVHLPNSHYITESDKFVYLYDSRKNVQRWWHAISARHSWQEVLKHIKVDEELKKEQQQQGQRGHPTTTRNQIRLDSQNHTGTKSQTILVRPPASIISTSPTAPQTEEPHPTETSPDETSISSRPAVPHDAQGNTEEETVESSSSGAQLLDSPLAAAFPPKLSLDDDGYAAPRWRIAQDANATFQDSKPAASVPSGEQPLTTWQPVVTPPRQEMEDSHSTTSVFRKNYPYIGDSTRQAGDTAFVSRQIRAEDTTEETRVADSASSSAKPTYIPRTALPLSEQAEAEEDAWDKGRESQSISSKAQPTDPRSSIKVERVPSVYQDCLIAHDSQEQGQTIPTGVRSDGPAPKHQQARVVPSTSEEISTPAAPSRANVRDDHSTEEPLKRDTVSDRKEALPLLGKEPPSQVQRATELLQEAAPYGDMSSTSSTIDKWRHASVPLQDAKDAQAKVSDSRSSIGQPSDTRAVAPLTKQEVPDTSATKAPFQTRYLDTTGTTKEAKGTLEESKIPDSASSQVQPLDSQRPDVTSRKREATEHSPRATSPFKKGHYDVEKRSPSDEDIIKRPGGTASAPRRTTAQDANGTYQDSKPAGSVPSRKQPLSTWQPVVTPPRQEIEDSHSTTSAFGKTYPYVEDSTRQAGDTAFAPRRTKAEETTQETKVADSTSSSAKPTYIPRTALPLSEQAEAEEDAWDKGRKSQSTSSKAQPTDPRSPIKVERVPSVYQEDPRIAQDSHEQAQTIPTGVRSDGPAPKHQQARVVPSTSEEISTPSAPPRANVRDDHSTEEPLKRHTVGDRKEGLPLLGKEPTSQVQRATELLHEAAPYGNTSSKSSTIDQWQRASVPLQDTKDAQAKFSDSGSSTGQPSDARAAAPLIKQEVPDARGTNAPFQTRYPDTKGTTKEAKGTFEETKIPDSASSQVQPLDAQTADDTSRKKEATENSPRATSPFKKGHTDAEKRSQNDEDIIKRPRGTASAPGQTTAQDANGTFQDSQPAGSVPSREQPLSTWQPVVTPPRQEIEDSHRTTSAFGKTYPYVEDSTRQAGGTDFAPRQIRAEDTNVADSASSSAKPTYIPRTAPPLSEQAEAEEDAWDKGRESQSTSSKAQPTDPRSPIMVERAPSVYQEDPRIAQDSHEQAQTIPTGVRSDDPASKHQQARVVPSTSEEISTPSAPPRANVRDDHSTEEPLKRDTIGDRKEVLPLLGIEPTSQVQRATEPLQQAAPYGDTSSKSSTIDQWRRASVLLQDAKDAQAKVSDSGCSTGQPSDARAAAPLIKQEVPDARGTNAPFQTRYPDTKGTTKEAKGTFEETKVPDSASSQVQHLDPQTADDTSGMKEATEDSTRATSPFKKGHTDAEKRSQNDEDIIKRPRGTASAPRQRTAQDANGTFQDSEPAGSVPSREQPLSTWQPVVTPPRQEIEDSHSTTSAFGKTYPYVEDSTRQAGGTAFAPRQTRAEDTTEDTKVADSASSSAKPTYIPRTAPPLSEQAADEEDAWDKGRESQSTSSKAQPTDPRSPIMVEKAPSVYQEDPRIEQHSHEHAQTIPTGVRSHGPAPKHQQARVVPSTSEEISTPSAQPRANVRDDHSTEEPLKRDTIGDRKEALPLLGKEPTSQVQRATEQLQEAAPYGDTSSKPSTIDQWRRASVPLQDAKDAQAKVSDSGSSTGQPSDARAAAPLIKQEVPDGRGTNAPFQTRYPDTKGSTKEAKGTFEETKIPDSASSQVHPLDPQTADDTSRKKEATEDSPRATSPFKKGHTDAEKRSQNDEDIIKRPRGTASAPRRTTAQDSNGTFQDSEPAGSVPSKEQPWSTWQPVVTPPRQEIEDSHSTTSAFGKTYPYVEDSTRQAGGTAFAPRQTRAEDTTEDTKVADSASSSAKPTYIPRTAPPLSEQAADEEDAWDKGRESQSTSSKAQPTDPRSPIMVERAPSVYQEDPRIEQDSHEHAQTIPTGVGSDGPAPKHQQARVVPSTSEEISTPSAPPRANVRDDHSTEEPLKRDTIGDRKEALPLLGKEPTSQVQRATEPLQEAAPYGDTSSKSSTIDQWRRASVPLQDAKDSQAKVSDCGSSTGQPSDAQAAAPLRKQEVPDARGTNAPFGTRYPDTKGTTKEAKGTFEETKIPDSASSQVQPLDPQTADDTSRKKEATEDSPRATSPFKKGHTDAEKRSENDEDIIKRPRGTASAPRRRTAQDANGTFQDSEPAGSVPSREQPLSTWQPVVTPPRQEIEDSHSTTSAFGKTYPYVEDSTRQAGGTAFAPRQSRAEDTTEDTKVADSASSSAKPSDIPRTARPLSEQAEAEEDAWDKGRESQSTSSKAQPTDPRSRIKVERPPSVYQEDPRIAQDSREQAQTIPTGVGSDGPAPKHQQARVVPSSSEEISTPSASPRANVRDDHSTEEPLKRDTVGDRKEGLPLLGIEPTSQVQRATEPLQEAAPYGDTSSKSSTIDQWRRASVPLQDAKDSQAKVSDSGSSTGQPSDAQAAAPLIKQEVPDARGTNAPFGTRYPDTKGTTKEAKGTSEERKIPDSASSQVQPLDSQTADDTSRKKEATEDSPRATSPFKKGHSDAEKRSQNDEDIIKRPRGTASAPGRTAAQDATGTFQDSKPAGSVPSREQPLSTWQPVVTPPIQGIEDSHSTTSAFGKTYPYVEDSTRQAGGTAFAPRQIRAEDTTEETKVADSASSSAKPTYIPRTALPLSEQAEAEEDAWVKGRESQSTSSKAQPTDPRIPIKVERAPSVYQEDPRIEQDSHEQAQTIPTGVKSDGPAPKHQQARVVSSTSEEISTPSAPPRANVRDDHSTEEPFKRDTVGDRKEVLPLLGKEPTSQVQRATEPLQEAAPYGDTPSKSSTIDQWRRASVPLQDAQDAQAKVSDSGSSTWQPSDARAAAPLIKHEVPDARGTNAPFGTRYPDTKGTTKEANGTFEEKKNSDSASSQVQPLDSQTADDTSRKKEATEDSPRATSPFKKGHSDAEKRSQNDEDIIKRPGGTASAPRRTTAQDANGTFQDSKPSGSVPSREQPLCTWQPVVTPPRQGIEDSHRTTSAFGKTYPYVEDSTRQAGDTAVAPRQIRAEDTTEDTKVADSASSSAKPTYIPRTALPLSEQAEAEEDAWDKGRESQSATSKAQPTDPRSPIKVERPPSGYQEDPRIEQDSHEQAQTIPIGVRSDGPAPKHQQARVVPSTSEEISTPSAPPRANVRDDHSTEEPFKRDTVGERKEALPLLGKGPTSEAQRATELLQEAAPDGDTSSKSSTIEQWRRASVPLQDVFPKSGDDILGVSTIDQQPIPMSREAIPSARGANEVIKRTVEQRFEPPGPTGAQTSDVQHAPPSLPGAATVERAGELVQTQAPTLDAHPTSAATPIKRATPDAHETGDQEFVNTSDGQRSKTSKASHDSAIIHDDVSDASLSTHGATVHDKTTTSLASEAQGSGTWPDSTPTPVNVRHPASDDELARRYLRDQGAQPSESTQEQTPLEGPHDSVSTKDVPSDAFARTKFAKPTSTEGMSPTSGPASTLEAQLASTLRAEVPYAEQKFAPSDKKSALAAQPLPSVESGKEYTGISAADQTKTPQTIFRQQPRPPAPITREIPTSDTRHDTRKKQDITLDNLPTDDSTIPPVPSHQQVPHPPKTVPDKNDMTPAPGTRDSPASDTKLASAKVQEVIPDNYRTDELKMPFVSSEKQGFYAGPSTEPHEGPSPDARSAVVHKETTKSPSRQAPVLEARPDSTPTDSYVRPTSGDEPGSLPDRGAESPTAAQATYSEDLRNSASTRDIPANALGSFKKPGPRSTTQKAISSTPHQASDLVAQPDSAKGEVSPATKKFAPSDQDSVHSTQQPSLAKPGKEDAIVAAAERTLSTVIGQQETQGMRMAPPSDIQHASSKIEEVDHDMDLDKSVPSQEEVSQAGHTSESREGLTPHVHSSVVDDKGTTVPSSLTSISDAALDSTPTSSDIHPASGIEPGVESPSGNQAPQVLKDLDSVPAEDIRADASAEAQSMRPSVSPGDQRGRPGEVALADQKPSPSGQDSSHSIQPPFSAEPRNEEIKDSARSAQPLLSAAPDQTKDSETTIGQQDISPAPGTSKSPSSRTDYASGKLQEVAPDDHHIIESIPSQGQVSRAKHAFEPSEGPTRDVHTAIDEKTMRPPSSQAQSSDSKPDSTQNPSDELSARFLPNQVAQQHADTQAPPPLIGLYESKSTQDVPSDTVGKAKSLKPKPSSIEQEATASELTSAFTPDAHLASAPREVSPAGQKILLKDQDSPHSVQKPPLSDSTKEQSTVAAPDQAKASQTIFGQQDIAPSLTRMTDPSSDSQHASRKLQEVPPVDRRIHGSIPRQEQVPRGGHVSEHSEGPTPDRHGAIVEEIMTHTTGATSAPHAQHDASGEVEPLKATGEVTPADQNIAPSEPLSAVESRKEDSSVAETEQSEVPEPIIGQQDIRHAPGISEPVRDDGGNKESVSRKEQVSHDQRASEPHEGSHPDGHGFFVDKKTTAPSSQAQSSDANFDSSPIHGYADPRSGGQSITRFLPDQGAQQAATTKSRPPLEALQYSEPTRHVPADALGKAKPLKSTSVDQEVMSPTALPNTQPDTAPGEVATDARNYALPGQGIARPAQLPFSAEPTKEESIVAASDQTSGSQTIIGQQGITPDKDKKKNPLSEELYADNASRKSQDDDGIDESVPSQEQASLGEHASEPREGSTTDSLGANVNDKINKSSPVTSSLHNPQAQVPPRTQALPVDALGSPAFVQNIPADSLEKVESPRPPLTIQDVMAPMTGPAQAPDAPQGTTPGEATPAEQKFTPLDQDSTNSTRLAPAVESRKQISNAATADRTNVSRSSAPDTVPSEAALRELTKSAKSLLPMTGADPVQPPHEASFDFSSDEKTTIIKGDQANNITNVNLSANQAVGQSESSAVKRALSEASFSQENPEVTSTEEKSKQQQHTDTRSSKDYNTEANGIISCNLLTTSGDIQPSPPKESTEATEESRNQQHADQDIFQSTQDNEKQVEDTEAEDTGRDNHEEMNLDANTKQKNNGTSQGEALEQSGEHVPAIQPRSKKTDDSSSKSTKDTPSGIQTENISESSLRTSEESEQQVQTEGRTQGGEANAPGSKTQQPKETDLPGSNKSITGPSQAEASDKSEEETSSSIQSGDNNSSKLDGSTNDTKSDDIER